MTGFFDDYSCFFKTSQTSPVPDRLNARHEAIIESNCEAFTGARVLDLASHDGRWSFAALKAGASHVTGIEARQHLVDNAKSNFDTYGVEKSRYSFIFGDVFDQIPSRSFDIVLCLGFFYHTIRHVELLDKMDRTGAKLIIIDTEVTPLSEERTVEGALNERAVFQNPNIVQVFRDPVDREEMAISDELTRDGHTLVARPSRAAMAFWAEHFGFSVSNFDWQEHFSRWPERQASMQDYDERWRETFILSRKTYL